MEHHDTIQWRWFRGGAPLKGATRSRSARLLKWAACIRYPRTPGLPVCDVARATRCVRGRQLQRAHVEGYGVVCWMEMRGIALPCPTTNVLCSWRCPTSIHVISIGKHAARYPTQHFPLVKMAYLVCMNSLLSIPRSLRIAVAVAPTAAPRRGA